MNSIPKSVEIVARNGRAVRLGKESAHVHKLICRLRAAGLTWDDLVETRNVPENVLERFIAGIRGIEMPDQGNEHFEFINLDREPDRFPQWDDDAVIKNVELLQDDRLGMWSVSHENCEITFGQHTVVVMKRFLSGGVVKGIFVQPTCVYENDSEVLLNRFIHLNLAAADWIHDEVHVEEGILSSPPFNESDWYDEKVFFLGTVWSLQVNGRKEIRAPAIVSRKDGTTSCLAEVLPEGVWPVNCYIAGLVPK